MRFLVDENISRSVINFFEGAGHNLFDIKNLEKRLADVDVLKLASKEKRIILTHDKDFVTLSKESSYKFKFILIRAIPQTKENMIKAARFILELKLWEKFSKFAIVEIIDDQVRMYKE